MKTLLFLILMTLSPLSSWGIGKKAVPNTIDIKLVFLAGDNWIGDYNSRILRRDLQDYLQDNVNASIKVRSVTVEDFIGSLTPEHDLSEIMDKLRAYSSMSHFNKTNDLVHFVLPRYKQEGLYYTGGFATDTCSLRDPRANTSYSNAGESQMRVAMIAAAHEIGHQLGATHILSKTLMNFQVLGFANGVVKVDKKSMSQIDHCLDSL